MAWRPPNIHVGHRHVVLRDNPGKYPRCERFYFGFSGWTPWKKRWYAVSEHGAKARGFGTRAGLIPTFWVL